MRRVSLIAVPLLLSACSDPWPGTVDEEISAFDLAGCAQGLPVCVRSGDTSPIVAMSPEDGRAIRLGPGASIDAPLAVPFANAHLAFVTIGLRAPGDDGFQRELEVLVDGKPIGVATSWVVRFFRTDISGQGMLVPPGARITLRATKGYLDVVYVVGRWNH